MRVGLVVALLLLLAGGAAAQETPSIALAIDAGPAFPLGDFSDDGADIGWGVGVSATARFTRLLGLFVALERASFDVADAAAPGDGTWTDDGMSLGVRLWVPVRHPARLQPWVQLGLGWHDLDPPIAGTEFGDLDTDGIATIEGGGGVDVAMIRDRVFLRPALRYRKYDFELELSGETRNTSISSLTLALGVSVVFGLRHEPDVNSSP